MPLACPEDTRDRKKTGKEAEHVKEV